jgi:hypothetical protein
MSSIRSICWTEPTEGRDLRSSVLLAEAVDKRQAVQRTFRANSALTSW